MTLINKERLLEAARVLAEDGRIDRAIKEYEKILSVDPKDLRVKIKIAELQVRKKHINEAIKLYKEVAEQYENDSFYLKAVTIYKNILRLNPALIEINEKLAYLYQKMGLVADSVRQYEILAVALEQNGMWDDLLDIRQRVVDLKPNDGMSRIRLAEIFQRQGMLEEALDQYELYADQLEKVGDEKKLCEVYERILPHRPENYDLLRKLVEIYYKHGEKKKAIKWLENAKDYVDQEEELLELKANLYASFNQLETARSHYLMLAELLAKNDKKEQAVSAYEEVCFIEPAEEDELKDKVEELISGEWANVLSRLEKRRKLAEEEPTSEEDADEPSASHITTKPNLEEKEEIKTDKVVMPESVEKNPKDEPKKSIPKKSSCDAKTADGALALGNTYWKMGLHDEAKAEWERAKTIYSELVKENPKLKTKLSDIENLLSQKETDDKKESKPLKEDKTKKEERKSKKKKISYV